LYSELCDATQKKAPIVYLDEVNFTKSSIQSFDWSGQNANITVDQRQIYIGYKSVIAAISSARGSIFTHIYDAAVDRDDFAMYLKALSKSYHHRPFYLMMDNLAVHKTDTVRDVYRELRITPVFNVSYSPQYNPIESVFSIVKREYCKQRLHHVANNLAFDVPTNIRSAFKTVTKVQIQNCIRLSFKLI
jgi:hypothetical protein